MKWFFIIVRTIILLTMPYLCADMVTVINKTPIDLYGAVYYLDGSARRVQRPFALPAGKKTKVSRPERHLGSDRELYFSPDITALIAKLSSGQAQFIPHFNMGTLKGDIFYIVHHDGSFKGYNYLEKKIAPLLEELQDKEQQLTDAMYETLQRSYASYKHKKSVAHVRTDNKIGQAEQAFLVARKKVTKKALEKIIGRSLTDQEAPTVALCASGGGYRAMISFLGSIEGMKKSELFDTVSYMAGLSGGAWGVSLATMLDDPLADIAGRLNEDLTSRVDTDIVLSQLWKKYVFQQPLSIIDIFGLLLVNRLLGGSYKKPMRLTLSDQIKRIEQGKRPFPLYTAVVTKEPYEWVEFSPYEIRSDYLHGAIPTWALGSPFNKGTSQSIDPEQSLGFFMGVWGSAMSISFQEAFEVMRTKISSPLLKAALKVGTSEQFMGSVRILPAQVNNFTFGMAISPRWQQEIITLVDAGLDFNIPLPPLLGRADIIFIFDNSASVLINKAGALKLAEEYISRRGVPFPLIDHEHIVEKQCSIFFDRTNPKAPLVIYFPLMSNAHYLASFDVQKCIEKSYCSTDNFNYSAQNIKELAGLASFNMVENSTTIRQAIKEFIEMRGKNSSV